MQLLIYHQKTNLNFLSALQKSRISGINIINNRKYKRSKYSLNFVKIFRVIKNTNKIKLLLAIME